MSFIWINKGNFTVTHHKNSFENEYGIETLYHAVVYNRKTDQPSYDEGEIISITEKTEKYHARTRN